MNKEPACGLVLLSKRIRTHSLLTSDEVATITGLSMETLAQWRSQKRNIPYLKMGRAVRYDPADVQAYLEDCRVSVSVPKGRRQI
jgi:excisionase family DNA binding protein